MTGPGWQLLQATATDTAANGSSSLPFVSELPVPAIVIRLAIAILLVIGAWYLSRLFTRMIGRNVARRFQRPSVSRTVLRTIRTGAILIAAFAGLAVLGLRISDLTLSVGVFSAVVGIILAPIVGSIINGFFVLADQPYEIGDMIELVDRERTGYVEDITLRYTKIFTLDNTFLVVPNGTMRERDVINYSAEDKRTRLSLDLLVTYEGDLDEAREIAESAARSVEGVITGGPDIRIGSARYPAGPTCYIESFSDFGIQLRLRYWVEEPYKLLTMRSLVQDAVWDRLAEANVEIAYPHSHLIFDETSGTMQVDIDGNGSRSRPQVGRDPGADGPRHADSESNGDG